MVNSTLNGDASTGDPDVGTMSVGTLTAVPTPEPASLTLLGGSLALLGLRRRTR